MTDPLDRLISQVLGPPPSAAPPMQDEPDDLDALIDRALKPVDPLARKRAQMAEAAEIAAAQTAGMGDAGPGRLVPSSVLPASPMGMATGGILGDVVEGLVRGGASAMGALGAFAEREGRQLELPPEDPPMSPAQQEAMAKMRSIYAVGSPGVAMPALAAAAEQPYREMIQGPVAEPLVEQGVAAQARGAEVAEAFPRPAYAQDFWQGIQTDPAKTLAVSAAENLPNLVAMIGASAVNPALGLGTAYALETGGAYQEAKEAGLSEEQAQEISGWVGLGNMGLEYLPAGRLLKGLKGGTDAAKKRLLTEMLKQAASEGGTETLQEANQMVVQAIESGDWPSFGDFVARIGEAGVTGSILGFAGGGAGAAVQPQIEEVVQPVRARAEPVVDRQSDGRGGIQGERLAERGVPPVAPPPVAPEAAAGGEQGPRRSPVIETARVFRSEKEPARTLVVHPSAREPGRWQLTSFDGDAPTGHTTWDSAEDAAASATGKRAAGQIPVGSKSFVELRRLAETPPTSERAMGPERFAGLNAALAEDRAAGTPPTDRRQDLATRQRLEALPIEQRQREIDAARIERFTGQRVSAEEAGARRDVIRGVAGKKKAPLPPGPGRVPQPPAEVVSGDPWVVDPARAAELRAADYPKPLAILEGGHYRIETAPPAAPETEAVEPSTPEQEIPRDEAEAQTEAPEASPSERVLALAQRLGRRPKVPEIQREVGVNYSQAQKLWVGSKGWEAKAGKGPERIAPAAAEAASPVAELPPGPATTAQAAEIEPQNGAQAPLLAAAETKPRHPVVIGSRDSAVSERGSKIDFDYAVVDARDLVTSNDDTLRPNPAYPQEIQPRDRTRATSEAQVSSIQKKLNPELLAASPRVSDGAPIIGEDRVVESGNARSIGIRRAYKDGGEPSQRYRARVSENASRFGLDQEAVAGIEQPVLVRIRKTPVDRAEFAREANEATVASMSATERARSDAARLTPEMLEGIRFPDVGEVNWNAGTNRDFVTAFASKIPQGEQGAFYDAQGQISREGQQRIQNAVLARAYGDADAIARLVEDADSNVRNIGTAMLREAPRMARLKADAGRGVLHQLDISVDIAAALRKLSQLRSEGTKVETYLGQSEMFGEEMTPESRELLGAFSAASRSPRQVSDILRRYHDLAVAQGDPRQAGLMAGAKPERLDLLQEAIATASKAGQVGLFPGKIVASFGEAGAVRVPGWPSGARKGGPGIGSWASTASASPSRPVPQAGPVRRWLRKYSTANGAMGEALFETKVARDGRLAKHLNRIDALARDLWHQMRRYRGTMSREQLARYLDNAYRGMNLRTGGEALDEAQIQRIARKRGVSADEVRQRAARQVPEDEAGLRSAPQFIPIIREMRAHTDAITRSLRRAGLLDDAVARELERHFGLYVHRQYEAVRNPRWAKRVKDQPLWNRAFELTKAKWAAAGKPKSDAEIWGLLASYVNKAGGPGRVILPGGTPEGAKDLQILRQRGDVDDFRRLLLGEVREAGSNFFTTSVKMATLLEQEKFLQDFSRVGLAEGKLAKRPVTTKAGEELIEPIDPGTYAKAIEKAGGRQRDIGEPPGIDLLVVKRSKERTKTTETEKRADPLGGLYTSEEIMEELSHLFEHQSFPAWLQWYMRANYATKSAKTVWSIQATARNFLSNFLYVTMQGANPLDPKRFVEAGRLSYPRIFGSTNRQLMAKVEEYLELGLFDQGTDLGDLKRQEREAQIFKGDFVGAGRAGARGLRFAQENYAAPDNFSKAYAFESLLPAYKKAYPNKTEAEVKKILAGILRNTMQNYSYVPRGVQAVGARFPLVAPFLSFSEEIVRNTKNTAIIGIREIQEGRKTDNKALESLGRRKLVGLVAAYSIPSITAFAAHWLLNTDDEEEEAARRFLPPWTKNGTIITWARPDGSINVIDLSFMDTFANIKDPVLAALRGDLEGAKDELLTPVGEEILAGALMDIRANKKPTGGRIYNPKDTALSRQIDKGAYLWKVVGPGVMLTAGKIRDAANAQQLPEGQRRVLWQETMAVLGPRVSNYKLDKALEWKAKQFERDIQDAKDLEVTPARQRKMTDAELKPKEDKAVWRMRQVIREMADDIDAARTIGLDKDTIKMALREGDVPAWAIKEFEDEDYDAMVKRYLKLNQKRIDEAQEQYKPQKAAAGGSR